MTKQSGKILLKNLKTNWFFPISAMAFFCLNATVTMGCLLSLIISFVASLFIAARFQSVWGYTSDVKIGVKVFSALSAIGICLNCQSVFYNGLSNSQIARDIKGMLGIWFDIPAVMSIVGAAVAVFAVYFFVCLFCRKMLEIVSDTELFKGITKTEIIIYSVLFIASVAFVTVTFIKTDAFYGTNFLYDIIYSSDSPVLVKENVYLTLTHPENDLRQPLFAVFAAPFMGIPYLIGRLFSVPASIGALLLNFVQISMLFAANFVLAKILRFSGTKRICFMIFTCFTYTQFLFVLMMEQYIVAYFWLILCIYLICENREQKRLALWGVGGTLLTGMVLLPFMSDKTPLRDFKGWFRDMVRYGVEFVALLLVFCRFDVIYNLTEKVTQLSEFTGKAVSFGGKILQYLSFVSGCFIAPNAGIDSTTYEHISWQLVPATSISVIGIAILVLCAVSVLVNRDKKTGLLIAGWSCFSVILLLFLGWGTKENGLVLYSLYFGWSFISLIFQLVEKIETKLNTQILIPVFTAVCVTVMAVINVPAIIELIQFSINFYGI